MEHVNEAVEGDQSNDISYQKSNLQVPFLAKQKKMFQLKMKSSN